MPILATITFVNIGQYLYTARAFAHANINVNISTFVNYTQALYRAFAHANITISMFVNIGQYLYTGFRGCAHTNSYYCEPLYVL